MGRNRPLQFDANATMGVQDDLWLKVSVLCEGALNPSSIHSGGQRARALIEEARQQVRLLVSAPAKAKVIFTSGATEANLLALSQAKQFLNWQIISSAIEHPSILGTLSSPEFEKRHQLVFPNRAGIVSVESVLEKITPNTRLVSIMYANNETGVIQPIAKIAALLKKAHPQILIHTDAVQAAGKLGFSWNELGVDMLTLSGHKLGSFPGVGALICRPDLIVEPFLLGGPQESRLRAGTENLPGIVSMGLCAERARLELTERTATWVLQKQTILETVQNLVPEIRLTTDAACIPNTLHLFIPGIRGDDLVVALDLLGIATSTGAACASGKIEPSHVLLAMGLNEETARSSLRISLGLKLRDEDIAQFSSSLADCIRRLQKRTSHAHL
jgi:cysteine desulfurase